MSDAPIIHSVRKHDGMAEPTDSHDEPTDPEARTMLHIKETYLNTTEGYCIGESDVTETFTDDRGELYRALRAEYGRCTGKVYIDTDNGVRAIGWVFVKRARYEDSPETYLREVWATVHRAADTVTREVHYA
jgi:hypothetical protein